MLFLIRGKIRPGAPGLTSLKKSEFVGRAFGCASPRTAMQNLPRRCWLKKMRNLDLLRLYGGM